MPKSTPPLKPVPSAASTPSDAPKFVPRIRVPRPVDYDGRSQEERMNDEINEQRYAPTPKQQAAKLVENRRVEISLRELAEGVQNGVVQLGNALALFRKARDTEYRRAEILDHVLKGQARVEKAVENMHLILDDHVTGIGELLERLPPPLLTKAQADELMGSAQALVENLATLLPKAEKELQSYASASGPMLSGQGRRPIPVVFNVTDMDHPETEPEVFEDWGVLAAFLRISEASLRTRISGARYNNYSFNYFKKDRRLTIRRILL